MNITKFLASKAAKVFAAAALVGTFVLPITVNAAIPRDPDPNSIVWNGAETKQELIGKIANGDGHNSAANIQQIYYNENRGITRDGATSIMSDQTVEGVVNKNGTVVVNGQTVATNVWSSGRDFMTGSSRDGSVWMRPPAVSFRSNSLPAFVNMAGGSFHWAIIKSCGNPVRQLEKPFGVIFKHVIPEGSSTSFAADDQAHAVEVLAGSHPKYEITVANAGTSVMRNVNVTDTLPAGVEMADSPNQRNFAANLGDIQPNKVGVATIAIKVTSSVNGQFITNKACFLAEQNQMGCDTAVIKVKLPKGGSAPPVTKPPVTPEQPTPPTTPPTTTTPTTPAAPLPQTGMGALAGLGGTGALGYAVRGYARSKRSLVDALTGAVKR